MTRGGGGIGPNTYIGPETRERAREFLRAAARNARARQIAAEEQRQRQDAEGRLNPVDWILEHFRIPETPDRRLQLSAYQEWALRRILTPNEDGTWRYGTVIWSDVKKSIKSTLAAAVALYIGSHSEYGSIYIIANDLKQADSRVAYYLRRAIELNREKFGNVRVTGRRILWPNGTFAEAIPIDPTGEAGSNADLVVFSELWGAHSTAQQRMWCYDDETEILARRGWLGVDELRDDDEIAAVDGEGLHLSWEQPRAIFRGYYRGPLHVYETKTANIHVTPEHRLFGIFSHNGKRNPYARHGTMRSRELRASGFREFYPATSLGGYAEEPREPVCFPATKFKPAYTVAWDDWCALVGWFVSEGWVKSNGNRPCSVVITQDPQANPEKWARLRTLLDRIFGERSAGAVGYSIQDSDTSFRIHSAPLARRMIAFGNRSRVKRLDRDILDGPASGLRRCVEAMIDGDGHRTAAGSAWIATHSERLADEIAEAGIKLGHAVSVRYVPQSGSRRVALMDGKAGHARLIDRARWAEHDYDGVVWCPAVSTGLVVTRRHGKIAICGNTEMTLSPTKYGRSMRWIETYAGHTGEAPLLEQLYGQGAAGASLSAEAPREHHWGEADLPAWQIPDARLFMLWNDTPRLPWQTPAYYREEAALLLPREFLRVHRNQWVTSEEAFVPIEWWDACGDLDDELDGGPLDFPAETRLVLAADASVTGDTTGLLGVSRHPDKPDHVIVRLTASWQPSKARPMDYDKTLIPKIEDAVGRWNVLELAYDPYQLHQSMVRLRRKGTVWCRAFDQNAERLKADKALYDMIRERRIHYHRGHHPVLRQHVLNANAKTGGPDAERMRIVKRANKDPVDLAVTLSMACHEALRLSL